MGIFADKNVKAVFIAVSIILFCLVVLGQVTVKVISEDYKERMIAHDYKIAGHLSVNNPGTKKDIIASITGEKNGDDLARGRELLEGAGYTDSISETLVPDVGSFHRKYSVIVLILSIAFSLAILEMLYLFFSRHYRKLEKANADILGFMNGNYGIRLDSGEEGGLSRLFSSINTMATSLTAHAAKEKQNKEFLRDTISDISHQLKTPLAALKMYNEIIEGENTGNVTVDNFIEKSANELNRMESLIRNLLKLARLDADSIELEKRDINLKDFLAQSLKGLFTRAELENKSLTLECDDGILLNCDEEWLLEAVSNIVKNALDHTEAGNRVAVLCDETPIAARISIRDNGKGIHPEDIHHIFKRFYRSRFSKDRQGAGIGLTLSKLIVEKHGGSITVESEPGKGTTFQLLFPKLTNL